MTQMLAVIIVLLAAIVWKLGSIERRLKEQFPTDKEADKKWAHDDPMGHYEAHKNDKGSK
ncbi:MAG TPA: hypothetical protein VMH20_07415 [Verrucomicrobiae bacterium]|nr:hypothetical protein [Verrucomicrobiae bacterium]